MSRFTTVLTNKRVVIASITAVAVTAALVSASMAIATSDSSEASEAEPTSDIMFAEPVDDVTFAGVGPDVLVDTGAITGPVFAGDYGAYVQQLRAARAQKAAQEEAERIAEQQRLQVQQQEQQAGAVTDQKIDAGNIAAPPAYVELPPITMPPISPVEDDQGGATSDDQNTGGNWSVPSDLSSDLPADYRTLTQCAFTGKSLKEKINLIGALARQDMRESGILASVTIAQCILESGWMESGLAKYNGMFGIKACAMENNWADSPWTGTGVNMQTKEEYTPGTMTEITACFRTYPNVWNSIKDHSAYLVHAKKGASARYPGIVENRDPRSVITIIKNGGYATASDYGDYIMRIIDMYDLTRFDR